MSTNAPGLTPCLVHPPPQLYSSTVQLIVIADALETGEVETIRDALNSIDLDACRQYWLDCGNEATRRHNKEAHLGRDRAKRVTVSKAVRRTIGERDGWRCRYCALPVVWAGFSKSLFEVLVEEVGDDANDLWRVFNQFPDHIAPVSAGGSNTVDSIVSTCGPCNFGKFACEIDELGLENPLTRDPILDGWTGLVGRPRLVAPPDSPATDL